MSTDAPTPYPKVDPRRLPGDRAAHPRALGGRRHLRGIGRAAARPDDEYVFYDGPPFANGLPHYGHLLTGYVKDVVPRYQTMRGQRVERRFGWDCHGLPVEMEAEKELGVSGRSAITEYGIDTLQRLLPHLGAALHRRVGALRHPPGPLGRLRERLQDDGPLLHGVASCGRSSSCGTRACSTRPTGSCPTRGAPRRRSRTSRSASTTPPAPARTRRSPWRSRSTPRAGDPGAAQHPGLDDHAVDAAVQPGARRRPRHRLRRSVEDGRRRRYVLGARPRSAKYAAELGEATTVAHRSRAPSSSAAPTRRCSPTSPTHPDTLPGPRRRLRRHRRGHRRRAHGARLRRGRPAGLRGRRHRRSSCPSTTQGRFTDEVPDWAGVNVFDANPEIIRHLKAAGRRRPPRDLRPQLPALLAHRHADHLPGHVVLVRAGHRLPRPHGRAQPGDQLDPRATSATASFGKWLEGARDWSISRNRFWGSPIPVWKSDDPAYPRIDVYGSLDELERDFGVRPDRPAPPVHRRAHPPQPRRPHRPQSTMRRVPEVLDCWFESGSMPFAQVHYPFENKEWFEAHSPADFIVEYIAQTRGWFYTMHVLSTALFDRPAFQNCICHGVVLDAEGRKLSKRLRNYPDPEEVFETIGSDALRWFLMSSPILRGLDLRIAATARASPRSCAWCSTRSGTPATSSPSTPTPTATGRRSAPTPPACSTATSWPRPARWSRPSPSADRRLRPRRRLPQITRLPRRAEQLVHPPLAATASGRPARSTPTPTQRRQGRRLRHALHRARHARRRWPRRCCRSSPRRSTPASPASASVHLADWPDAADAARRPRAGRAMDEVRAVCSAALGLREEHRLRVRLPLPSLTVAGARRRRARPFAAPRSPTRST